MNKEEKIQYANFILEEITTKFLQKDNPYIILEGYEYFREVITLYAKQSNLFESALLLIENNHAEEAFVLVRSMLNNSMLIQYLCNDENGQRYKEYSIQPTKSNLLFLYNIRKALEKGWMKEYPLDDLDTKIQQHEEFLKQEGFTYNKKKNGKNKIFVDTNLLSIKSMALTDEMLFGYYMSFYNEGSKYEHSDISSLNIYRKPILDEYPDTIAFKLDLSITDIALEEKVLNLAINIYTITYLRLLQHLINKHIHLIPEDKKPELLKLALIIEKNNFNLS